MKRILVLGFVVCFCFSLKFPPFASGSADFGAGGDDPNCIGAAPQSADFKSVPYAYTFTGVCDLALTRLNLPVRVIWTGVGRWDPTKGQAFEDIIVPAPRIDEPSRPYGRFTATMHCNADPWLNPNITCDHISPTVDAPLDRQAPNAQGWKQPFALGPSILQGIYDNKRPFTSIMREDAVRSLNAQYQTYLASLKAQRKEQEILQATPQQTVWQNFYPTILSPTGGQRFYAQMTVPIRLAPPSGWKVTSYLVSIQKKDARGNWAVQTNIPVPAAQAQSAQGYTGFGTGGSGPTKSPAFLTGPGAWGVRAQISAPNQSGWSNLVEFTVVATVPLNTPAGVLRK